MKNKRLGSGTAWARDRFQLALDIVDRGNIDYLIFESMSEVTMSNAQVNKINNPELPGYDPYLERRIGSVLMDCVKRNIKIISNQGWLDPEGAAEKIVELARNIRVEKLRVGAVVGGDLKEILSKTDLCLAETDERISELRDRYVSAEAYLGAEWIVEALKNDAQVVITPRVADASLYVGPLAYEYNWDMDDWDRLGKGTVVVTVFPDDNKKYLSTDLSGEEPIKDNFLSPDLKLIKVRAFKRVCYTCCDPQECIEANSLDISKKMPLPHCPRRQ